MAINQTIERGFRVSDVITDLIPTVAINRAGRESFSEEITMKPISRAMQIAIVGMEYAIQSPIRKLH